MPSKKMTEKARSTYPSLDFARKMSDHYYNESQLEKFKYGFTNEYWRLWDMYVYFELLFVQERFKGAGRQVSIDDLTRASKPEDSFDD
uniref:Uncharacterized protein n=2 Tax=unclassified Microvirus TaxID=338099 RepID=A0AAU8B6T1_9VIRU